MVKIPFQDGKKTYDSASVMPYRSLVIQNISSIIRAIGEGRPGLPQARTLIKSLPAEWEEELTPRLKEIIEKYGDVDLREQEILKRMYGKSSQDARKDQACKICSIHQQYSSEVMQAVISFLHDKKLLLYEEMRPREVGWGADFEAKTEAYL